MGWTAYPLDRFSGSSLSFLKARTRNFVGSSWGDGATRYEITALQAGPGGVYGIITRSVPNMGDVDLGLIIPVRRKLDTVYIKPMTELSGPYYHGMPERLFKRLSDLREIADQLPNQDISGAQQWRAAVAEQIANDKRYKSLRPGDIVEFKNDVVFSFKPKALGLREFLVHSVDRSIRFVGHKEDGSPFFCKIQRRTLRENPIVCIR